VKPAARLTDLHTCPMVNGVVPHVGGPILPTCHITTLIAGLPAARVTDKALCVGPPDVIVSGAPSTFIGGLPAARLGDQTAHGGLITMGCVTVLIGDRSGGAGGGAGGGGGLRAAAAATLQAMTMRDAKAAAAPFCEQCAAGASGGPPPSNTPQAATLRAARAAGTPFCEECD
jgi:uncharacterized Zn-binding protein involved in type VI secretion